MKKYSKAQLLKAVEHSHSVLGVLRYLGIAYCTKTSSICRAIKTQLDGQGISTAHFKGKGHSKGTPSPKKRSVNALLVVRKQSYREKGGCLRRALLELGVPYQCEICGLGPQWRGKPLLLQVDHKNGSWRDCRRTNLRFICPNCHSQEETSLRHKTYLERTCPKCGKTFRARVGKLGVPVTTFCSSACGSCLSPKPPPKAFWPTLANLKLLVWSKPVCLVAKELGISGSAIKKKCSKLGIPTPPRGYWSRCVPKALPLNT